MTENSKPGGLATLRYLMVAAALTFFLAGCSTLTDLFPGLAPGLEFVEPSPGSTVTVGDRVPVRVSTAAVSAPLESVYLEVEGKWVGALSDSDGDGEYTGSFTPSRQGGFSLTAIAVGEDGRIRTGEVELVGDDQPGFSIVVIPDTQKMIEDGSTMTDQMTEWIVGQVDVLDIEFVTHVGDVVDHGSSDAEWQRGDAALDRLDGAVPYSVSLGNHDYGTLWNKCSSTANFVGYFGPQRYSGYSWYGGSSANGLNHYQVFEAAGRSFLHLNLAWEPSDAGLDWARGVIESHPGLPTIITTHSYLWDEPGQEGHFPGPAQSVTEGNPSCPGNTGVDVFEALVKPYPQVFMVVGGHFHQGQDGEDGEYHQVSTNDAGLPVYEMLSDYQAYVDGGQGWLRIVQFIPAGGEGGLDRIQVRTYSPVLNEYQTDSNSEFQFDLSFASRWGLD